MLCGSIVAVVSYYLGFHIFDLFHVMNFTYCILPNFYVSIMDIGKKGQGGQAPPGF